MFLDIPSFVNRKSRTVGLRRDRKNKKRLSILQSFRKMRAFLTVSTSCRRQGRKRTQGQFQDAKDSCQVCLSRYRGNCDMWSRICTHIPRPQDVYDQVYDCVDGAKHVIVRPLLRRCHLSEVNKVGMRSGLSFTAAKPQQHQIVKTHQFDYCGISTTRHSFNSYHLRGPFDLSYISSTLPSFRCHPSHVYVSEDRVCRNCHVDVKEYTVVSDLVTHVAGQS